MKAFLVLICISLSVYGSPTCNDRIEEMDNYALKIESNLEEYHNLINLISKDYINLYMVGSAIYSDQLYMYYLLKIYKNLCFKERHPIYNVVGYYNTEHLRIMYSDLKEMYDLSPFELHKFTLNAPPKR